MRNGPPLLGNLLETTPVLSSIAFILTCQNLLYGVLPAGHITMDNFPSLANLKQPLPIDKFRKPTYTRARNAIPPDAESSGGRLTRSNCEHQSGGCLYCILTDAIESNGHLPCWGVVVSIFTVDVYSGVKGYPAWPMG